MSAKKAPPANPSGPSTADAAERPPTDNFDEEARHLEKMARLSLRQTQVKGPPGASLYDPMWVFAILEAHGGLIIIENEDSDPRWVVVYGAGLPTDMMRVDVVFSAAAYHGKYKDFAIHGRGVIVDPVDPEKGKGAWRWDLTNLESAESYSIHLWFVEVFLRNASAQLIAHYNPDTNPEYSKLIRGKKGIRIELLNHDPNDKQSSIRLIENDVLFTDLQSILSAAERAQRGRPPKALVNPETIAAWSTQYDDAISSLQSQLSVRGSKQFKKYPEPARVSLIKLAFPEIDNMTAEALSKFSSLSDVALRYTGLICSQVKIGTWRTTNYREFLRASDKVNGIARRGHGKAKADH